MKSLNTTIQSLMLVTLGMFGTVSHAAEDGMVSMPKISPKAVYEVKDPDALEAQSGFGNDAPSVKMMNLMMVEGSGMEGMDMSQMKMAQNETPMPNKNPGTIDPKMKMDSRYTAVVDAKSKDAHVGTNKITFKVEDSKSGKLATGLRLKAQVSMTSMDMGTEEPEIKEKSSGVYVVMAPFSMQGPWALRVSFPGGQSQIINFEAKKK